MKDLPVIEEMIKRKIIPEEGSFEITEKVLDSFYSIYPEIYPSKGTRIRNKDIRHAKKLAGLSMMKLLKQREENIEKKTKNRLDIKCGFLYVISNPCFPDYVKIGITKDLKFRLSAYQTCDPFRRFKVEHYRFFDDIRQKEKEILDTYKVDVSKGEWIEKKNLNDLLVKFL